MLKKFRRGSKEPLEDVLSNAIEHDATEIAIADESRLTRHTFFDLPAEIRNAIYEFVIADTTLSLSNNIFNTSKLSRLSLKRRKGLSLPAPQVNGLLLASRQCRREYLSFLFSTIQVTVEIQDFDFSNLIRVSSNLNDLQIQALECNPNLKVLLMTRNCSSKDLTSLRKWLTYRELQELNLPWKYEFPLDRLLPPTTMGRVRLLRELEYYADMVSGMESDLGERQKAELRAIVQSFQVEAAKLDDDLAWLGQRSKRIPSELRGLAGGGVM